MPGIIFAKGYLSLKFESKNSVEIDLIIDGEKSALEFHEIKNTSRKYIARYSLPKINPNFLQNGEGIKESILLKKKH